jgi:hypothetical protein
VFDLFDQSSSEDPDTKITLFYGALQI